MKVWIVGAAGLLGAEVHKLCQQRGIDSIATTRQEADITRKDRLEEVAQNIQPTHIINCAAFTHVDNAEKEQELAYQVNALGPAHLGAISRKIKAKILHISSDYVFPGENSVPYKEGDKAGPQGVYGKTKWEGECNLLRENPEACIVRTSWLFGSSGKNFISSLVHLMKTQSELKVVEDQKGRPTYFKDLAEVVIELLDYTGIVHFANEGAVSRYEMARIIFEHMQSLAIPMACRDILPVSSDEFITPAKRPKYSVLDTAKVEELLGKKPRHWKNTLQEYFDYVG